MEFCRFRDFAVPLLGLSTRHPSIYEMRVTQLVDSISRAPHLPGRRRNASLLKQTCQLAVFSGKLTLVEAEIDCKLQSNSN
jgi:hypothetical protein